MKLAGALLVILCCSALGLSFAEGGRRRLCLLEGFAVSLAELENELCSALRPLKETLKALGLRGDPSADFYRTCAENWGKASTRQSWEEAALAQGKNGLRQEECQALAELGSVLGRYGAERQRQPIRRAAALFEAAARTEREKLGREYRLRAGLGVGTGVLLVVLAL